MTTQGSIINGFDSSYKEFQHCQASSGTSVITKRNLLVATSVVVKGVTIDVFGECPTDMWRLEEGTDFTLASLPASTISMNRETQDTSDAFVQTIAGQLTYDKALAISPTVDSTLTKLLEQIWIADSVGGHNMELIKAYSNGGFGLETIREDGSTGTKITKVDLNMKLADYPDTFDGFDADSEISLNFTIEYSSLFILEGTFAGYGLPGGSIDASITATKNAAAVSVTPDVTLNGVEFVNDTAVYVEVFDEAASNAPIATMKDVPVGASTDIPVPLTSSSDLYVRMFLTNSVGSMLLLGADAHTGVRSSKTDKSKSVQAPLEIKNTNVKNSESSK